ncbi:MAG: DedA family protein [Cyanobacteriota bacterium]|nr:DedA family protein [Cyanobacteriota bacterium]
MFEIVSLEAIQDLAREYGYWVVFLGISLENAGIPLPGETITLVGGYLAGSGELNYWLVLACTTSGAILGDNFGYWIGRWGGWPLVLRLGRLFRFSEAQLLPLKTEFTKNAARAVLFGRFMTLFRIFAGPLAGIVEMSYGKFLLCNAAGALLWTSTIVSIAFFAGQTISLDRLVAQVAQFGVFALVGAVAIVAALWWWEHRKVAHTVEEIPHDVVNEAPMLTPETSDTLGQ